MSYHYPLAPSFAPVWGHCSGAVMAAQQFPNLETEATREGTAAHWVLSETLGWAGMVACLGSLGQTAPNGVVVDEKMCEGAQIMVDDVMAVCEKHGMTDADLFIEHGVTMPGVHPLNGGTLDVGLWVPSDAVLYVWDYKHGHLQCDVEENLQLIDYAIGLVEQLGADVVMDPVVRIELRIVQPFCYTKAGHTESWSLHTPDLWAYADRLRVKANEAFDAPKLTSGAHCRGCPAVGKCSATRLSGYNAITALDRPYAMDEMNAHDLAVERDTLKGAQSMLKARLDAIEDDLHHRITQGETGSGLALETGQGRKKWDCPPLQAEAIAQQFGFSITVDAVKTPTQAAQAAPKALRPAFETVLKTVCSRPVSGLKLVKQADSKTARAFGVKSK